MKRSEQKNELKHVTYLKESMKLNESDDLSTKKLYSSNLNDLIDELKELSDSIEGAHLPVAFSNARTGSVDTESGISASIEEVITQNGRIRYYLVFNPSH